MGLEQPTRPFDIGPLPEEAKAHILCLEDRVLSLTQACRMHDLATGPILARALSDHCKGQPNDTARAGQLT